MICYLQIATIINFWTFWTLCDVGIALESEEVVQALDEGKSYKEIKELLIEIT